MRLLLWHVDAFVAEPTERGRSKVADAVPRTVDVTEAVVAFAAAEQADEADPAGVALRAADAIQQVAKQLGVRTVVLHSFAHLFVDRLAEPSIARAILTDTQALLAERGFVAEQTAFGWFNRLEMRAKGHPYSRMARRV